MRPKKRDTDPGVTNPAHVAFDKTFVLTCVCLLCLCVIIYSDICRVGNRLDRHMSAVKQFPAI